MPNPQQPELRRSERGATDSDSTKTHVEVDQAAVTTVRGETGPVPVDNLPGHHPEREQDKPVDRFRRRAARVVEQAREEEATPGATTFEVRGLHFDGFTAGPDDGEAVVLLHGFPQSSRMWRDLAHGLAADGMRTVAFDQRGYSPGARPRKVSDYRSAELVEDVVAVADSLGIERFHVVGHDWGAIVGWALASSHPGRLLSLTALSTGHPRAVAGSLWRSPQLLRSAYIPFFVTPFVPDTLLRLGDGLALRRLLSASGLPGGDADHYARAMAEPGALTGALNWYRALGRLSAGPVEVPTMFVWGDHDVSLSRQAAEGTAAQVHAPYRFEVLEGAGHWLAETRPDEVFKLVSNHLAAHRGS